MMLAIKFHRSNDIANNAVFSSGTLALRSVKLCESKIEKFAELSLKFYRLQSSYSLFVINYSLIFRKILFKNSEQQITNNE